MTPDCRISPIVIFSGRFIAGGWWMRYSSVGHRQRRETETARRVVVGGGAPGRAGCYGGAEQFGWDDNTTDVDALWSRSRDLRFTRIDTLFNPQQLRQPRDLSCDAASFVF